MDADSMKVHTDKYDAIIERAGGLKQFRWFLPVSVNVIKGALQKGDEWLNTIPLHKWDACARFVKVRGLSLAEEVCTLKRAAVRLATKAEGE